jgi:hypothetical protein
MSASGHEDQFAPRRLNVRYQLNDLRRDER